MEPAQIPLEVRRLAIGFTTMTHIQIAALVVGLLGIGALTELIGIQQPAQTYFDRLAKGLTRIVVIIYSAGGVLAIVFIVILFLAVPTFWYVILRDNFWPFVLEADTFLLTTLFLFSWFFTWDRLVRFKWLHVSLGLAVFLVVWMQEAMIDVVASYMLTPAPPTEWMRIFLNPTSMALNVHRLVGDFSFGGFVIAGAGAVLALRARDPERRAYYDWVGNLGLLVGVFMLFFMPAIGIEYVLEIRLHSPGAFDTLMRGRLSWFFLLLVTYYAILFFLGVLYMKLQAGKSGRRGQGVFRGALILIGLSWLLLVQPYTLGPSQDHAWLNWVNPFGSMQPWKYIAFAALTLTGLYALLAYLGTLRRGLRWGRMEQGGRGAQWALLAVALMASGTMLWMGYIRESARWPYTIYYQILVSQPEQYPQLPVTPTPAGPSTGNLANDAPTSLGLDSGRPGD